MPRHNQDGRAARAGAADSIAAPLDLTPVFALLGSTEANAQTERETRALDLAYFAQHPEARSYTRAYCAGELPLLALLPSGGQPSGVAVGAGHVNGQPERVRLFLWPHHDRAQALAIVERRAARLGGVS